MRSLVVAFLSGFAGLSDWPARAVGSAGTNARATKTATQMTAAAVVGDWREETRLSMSLLRHRMASRIQRGHTLPRPRLFVTLYSSGVVFAREASTRKRV